MPKEITIYTTVNVNFIVKEQFIQPLPAPIALWSKSG